MELAAAILLSMMIMAAPPPTAAAAAGPYHHPHPRPSTMLVFGDSTVDPGNNNHLLTSSKANFPPYGRDFFGGRPTGRFSNGRLTTDLIAEEMGITKVIPAFLDPDLKPEQLPSGVSFASASSGYDDLTAEQAGVLTFGGQIKYFMHYKIHLRKYAGQVQADEIVSRAIFVISAGTNDFIQNYFLGTNRSKIYTVPQYQDFLVGCMSRHIKTLHGLGARKILLVGVPPMGCLPIVKNLFGLQGCKSDLNDVAKSFTSKLALQLSALERELKLKTAYLDVYDLFMGVTNSPAKYGFEEVMKGCCGTGLFEFGETCKGLPTCRDPSKYMYWDAVHPSERMYAVLAKYALPVATRIMG